MKVPADFRVDSLSKTPPALLMVKKQDKDMEGNNGMNGDRLNFELILLCEDHLFRFKRIYAISGSQALRQAREPVAELKPTTERSIAVNKAGSLSKIPYTSRFGWFGYCIYPVHNKVISDFQALRQARAPVAGLEPTTESSLQISR
ncbi:hypothetical protein PoB_006998900 [Plakobranchus ocellatus]|uniref:Uncharacterized protein n=1 Tax=Plakobranchus ocellatus TaxID=259542 RepID=A0AAV4DHI1_9GAST|nr:hypothetical protein PoB_006998900 [Plakobranchus ocellatus]